MLKPALRAVVELIFQPVSIVKDTVRDYVILDGDRDKRDHDLAGRYPSRLGEGKVP